jgi:hypothetical protein
MAHRDCGEVLVSHFSVCLNEQEYEGNLRKSRNRTSRDQWIDLRDFSRLTHIYCPRANLGVGCRDRLDWLKTLLLSFPLHMRRKKCFHLISTEGKAPGHLK